MAKKEEAIKNFYDGYNCAQSVVLAFHNEIGLDKETALKLASSFGGGIGRLREVCGAVSGMCIIAGLLYGYSAANDDIIKGEHYERIQKLAYKFKEEYGTYICRELLKLEEQNFNPTPQARTPEYYESRPCAAFVGRAAEIMEEYINGGT